MVGVSSQEPESRSMMRVAMGLAELMVSAMVLAASLAMMARSREGGMCVMVGGGLAGRQPVAGWGRFMRWFGRGLARRVC